MRKRARGWLLVAMVPLVLHAGAPLPPALAKIETVVVIYAENRSFDHLFGHFPGAEGLASATPEQKTQLDIDGTVLKTLPAAYRAGVLDKDLPSGLPNGPFAADQPPVNRKLTDNTPSPLHRYYQNRQQINGGKNNMYVAWSNVGSWVMATYDGSKLKTWSWAREYTLADHFFQAGYGGSFLNHMLLICACVPQHPQAPPDWRVQLDEFGRVKTKADSPASVMQGVVKYVDGNIGHDGYAVNSAQPPYQPSAFPPAPDGPREFADPAKFPLPPQSTRTIGDTLSAKGVSWAWYAEGWRAAEADGMRDAGAKRAVIGASADGALNFQTHHQPFNYFARFAPGTADRARHLKDRDDLIADIRRGRLPQVSFYKPAGRNNQHSGSSTIAAGDAEIDTLLRELRASPQWASMAIIVTYDENGGYWDHMPPPTGPGWSDVLGPGTRIPALIVSPYARKAHVDKTVYDTTSIIKFLTLRFGLEPLPGLREKVGDLRNAFVDSP